MRKWGTAKGGAGGEKRKGRSAADGRRKTRTLPTFALHSLARVQNNSLVLLREWTRLRVQLFRCSLFVSECHVRSRFRSSRKPPSCGGPRAGYFRRPERCFIASARRLVTPRPPRALPADPQQGGYPQQGYPPQQCAFRASPPSPDCARNLNLNLAPNTLAPSIIRQTRSRGVRRSCRRALQRARHPPLTIPFPARPPPLAQTRRSRVVRVFIAAAAARVASISNQTLPRAPLSSCADPPQQQGCACFHRRVLCARAANSQRLTRRHTPPTDHRPAVCAAAVRAAVCVDFCAGPSRNAPPRRSHDPPTLSTRP